MPGRAKRRASPPGAEGVGVDAKGGPVVDPTQNVLSLVDVEKEHARELRAANVRYYDAIRKADNHHHDSMRAKDNQRSDELDKVRAYYEARIDDMNTIAVKTTSDLIAVQLEKSTTSLSSQVDRMGLVIGERLSRLEQFRYESAGRGLGRSELIAWVVAVGGFAIGAIALFSKHS